MKEVAQLKLFISIGSQMKVKLSLARFTLLEIGANGQKKKK